MSLLHKQPKNLKAFIKKHGDKRIKSISICREPINSLFTKALKLLRKTPVTKFLGKYDSIFHLFLVMTLDDGKTYKTEKNERLMVGPYKVKPLKKNGECKEKRVRKLNLTVRKFFEAYDKSSKPRLSRYKYRYSAQFANCQMYLFDLLFVNNLSGGLKSFILQDTKSLLSPFVGSVVQKVTDAKAISNILRFGGGK